MLRDILRIIGIGLAVILGLGFALQAAKDDNDDGPDRATTPYEAACDMLGDGDTVTEAYDILIDLDIVPIAASRAVNDAMANGCG